MLLFLLPHLDFVADRRVHRKLEHIVNTLHFFAAALYICGTHPHCDSLALLGGYGGQALSSEKIDARAFDTKI